MPVITTSRAAASRAAAASGSRSRQRVTWPECRRRRCRPSRPWQFLVGQLVGAPDRGHRTSDRGCRRCRGPPKTGRARQLARARPVPCTGGGDDGGVRQHPARRDVTLLRRTRRGPCQSERTVASWRRVRSAWMPDVRRHGSSPRRMPAARRCAPPRTPGLGPLGLAGLGQQPGEHVAQRHEQFDVEGGVHQPVEGQRARRPVGGGVALLQRRRPGASRPSSRAPPARRRAVARRVPCRTGGAGRMPISARQGRSCVGGVQHPFLVADRAAIRARTGRAARSGPPGPSRRPARRSCTR